MRVIDFHVHPPFDAEERGISAEKIAEQLIEWMNRGYRDSCCFACCALYLQRVCVEGCGL